MCDESGTVPQSPALAQRENYTDITGLAVQPNRPNVTKFGRFCRYFFKSAVVIGRMGSMQGPRAARGDNFSPELLRILIVWDTIIMSGIDAIYRFVPEFGVRLEPIGGAPRMYKPVMTDMPVAKEFVKWGVFGTSDNRACFSPDMTVENYSIAVVPLLLSLP